LYVPICLTGLIKTKSHHGFEVAVTANTPKALRQLAPGCRNSGYPGLIIINLTFNPNGVAATSARAVSQLFQS